MTLMKKVLGLIVCIVVMACFQLAFAKAKQKTSTSAWLPGNFAQLTVGQSMWGGGSVTTEGLRRNYPLVGVACDLMTTSGKRIFRGTTDGQGTAYTINLSLVGRPGEITPGTYTLYWRFAGDSRFLPSKSREFPCRILKGSPDVRIFDLTGTVRRNQKALVRFSLTSEQPPGLPIVDRAIRVSVNGVERKVVRTNNSGDAYFEFSSSRTGDFVISGRFRGDAYFNQRPAVSMVVRVR